MEDDSVVLIQHADEKTVSLFDSLVDCDTLRSTGRGWVILQDAIVEIELLGDWLVTDRGPRLPGDISSQDDLGSKEPSKSEMMVHGRMGTLSLGRRSSDTPLPTIRITDRFVILQRTPSEHTGNRLDLRIRRG